MAEAGMERILLVGFLFPLLVGLTLKEDSLEISREALRGTVGDTKPGKPI